MKRSDPTTSPTLGNTDWTHPLYQDLRLIARALMRRERRNHTLQPTALVHEAWIRMLAPKDDSEPERRAALRRAVHWMRRILVDHARAKAAEKRGGSFQRTSKLSLDSLVARESIFDSIDLLTLDELLERLEQRHPRQAETLQLKLLAGFSTSDIADHFELSMRTVREDLAFAQAWVTRELRRDVSSS